VTVLMDSFEEQKVEVPVIRPLLEQMVPLEFGSYNAKGYPDYTLIQPGRITGITRKQAGELVSDIDGFIEQLRKDLERGSCDNMVALVEGLLRPAADGSTQSIKLEGNRLKTRLHHVPYNRIISLEYELLHEGIPVIWARDGVDTAMKIAGLYRHEAKGEHKLFSRLAKVKYRVSEKDAKRRDFMLTLMGIRGAGVGEEVADAIATFLEGTSDELSLFALMERLQFPVAGDLEQQPLRGGKRSIGPAAVAKLRAALGL
jgi:hypothetical protein